ncbi:MAG: glycosyltransferase [Bryobacteraceae bacterium]
MAKVQLSACIITQGLPDLLRKCLEDMSFADEIIVVDGGPDAATKAVAESHPRSVYIPHAWPANYSTQRNVYLRAARGAWILTVDTDERLDSGFAEGIDEWTRRDDVDGFCFPRCWRVNEKEFVLSENHYPDFNMRLFRNRPALRYLDGPENAVHHLLLGVEKPLVLLQSPIILHDCFLYENKTKREDKIRLYDRISSNQSGSRYKDFYLFEDSPHEICSVAQRPTISTLPWMTALRPFLEQ